MADKIATDFLTKLKAKSGEAIKWFKNIVNIPFVLFSIRGVKFTLVRHINN